MNWINQLRWSSAQSRVAQPQRKMHGAHVKRRVLYVLAGVVPAVVLLVVYAIPESMIEAIVGPNYTESGNEWPFVGFSLAAQAGTVALISAAIGGSPISRRWVRWATDAGMALGIGALVPFGPLLCAGAAEMMLVRGVHWEEIRSAAAVFWLFGGPLAVGIHYLFRRVSAGI